MAFKRCSIGTKGPKVCQENLQPEPLRQGRMDPCFHVLYVKFWPYHLNVAAEIETHQTRQSFSNLLLSNFGEPLIPKHRHPVCTNLCPCVIFVLKYSQQPHAPVFGGQMRKNTHSAWCSCGQVYTGLCSSIGIPTSSRSSEHIGIGQTQQSQRARESRHV